MFDFNECTMHRLKEGERIDSFDCGDEDLNEFVLQESHLYRDEMLSVSYVLKNQDGEVLAFFSLNNDKISVNEFENRNEFNRFRKHHFVNAKRISSYPAVKIGRLAVSVNARGLHIGSDLLTFIKKYFTVNNKTGCRFVTVDAYVNAFPFYVKNDFEFLTVSDEGDSHTRLLYFDLKQMNRSKV